MIEKYPEPNSLKQVFLKLPLREVRKFYKERGIILHANSSEQIADYVPLFFWGLEDINKISELLEAERNYKKSVRIEVSDISYCGQEEENEASMTLFVESMKYAQILPNEQRDVNIESITEKTNENEAEVVISYTRKKPGMVQLLDEEMRRVPLTIRKNSEGKLNIDINHRDDNDIKKVRGLLKTLNLTETTGFKMNTSELNLEGLTTNEKIQLFINFFGNDFDEWRLIEVKNLKVTIEKNEELQDNEDTKDVEEEELHGLNSALLSGNSLLTNPFVIKCLNHGFYFSYARILFEHKDNPKQVEIELNSKQRNYVLEVNVVSTYEIEDGNPQKIPFDDSEQRAYLSFFNDVLMSLHRQIRGSRDSNNKGFNIQAAIKSLQPNI